MKNWINEYKKDLSAVCLTSCGVLALLALLSYNPKDPSFNSMTNFKTVTNWVGYVGSFVSDLWLQLFGLGAWAVPVLLVVLGLNQFNKKAIEMSVAKVALSLLWLLLFCALLSINFGSYGLYQNRIQVGGIIGYSIAQAFQFIFSSIGTQVVLWSLMLMTSILLFEKKILEGLKWIYFASKNSTGNLWSKISFFKNVEKSVEIPKQVFSQIQFKQQDQPEFVEAKTEEDLQLKVHSRKEEVEPTQSRSVERRKVVLKTKVERRIENWELPKLSLLEDPPAARFKVDEKEIRKKAEILKDKLSQFSVTGEVVAAKPGPAVTMFEFKPAANVKLSKITELQDDVSLALSSESLRIIAPIPGRDVVGIETSNQQREMVFLKDALADENFWKDDIKLPIALGKQANGDTRIVDLRKMPHLMVAGTTGSGKSVFIVSTIIGLLFRHSPKTLRLILIDPKQVDLAAFEKVPHLNVPLVTETKRAVGALKWAVREMEKRYRSMNRFGARGLEAYNEAVSGLNRESIEEHEKINAELELTPGKKNETYYFQTLPYIVIVVEEFGDLMAVDKSNVEASIVRLAQMARACGIHLLLAMQSPRKEVVTGLIKTNIPGRISFKVSSSMDSRIILDDTGAERLLAQGDMLYRTPGGSSLERHHGPYLKDSEISAIAKFWSEQGEPEFDQNILKQIESSSMPEQSASEGSGEQEYDEKYDEILSWASSQKEISASLIQRRFQLGYPRAARLVETFEREGVVGPSNGSKPRQVLINSFNHLEE